MPTPFYSAKSLWIVILIVATIFCLVVVASLRRIEGELIVLRQGFPHGTEQKLKDFEAGLNEPSRWPGDPIAAETMRHNLEEIVQTLSPAALARMHPQLTQLLWGIQSLWVLKTYANAESSQLEEAQLLLGEMVENHIPEHLIPIKDALESRLKTLKKDVHDYRVKSLLERAKVALEGKEGKEDPSAVFTSLEEFRGEEAVDAMLPILRARVIEKSGLERIESYENILNKTLLLGDVRTSQVSLLNIQEDVLRLVVDLELAEPSPKSDVLSKAKKVADKCDQELLAIAATKQNEIANKVRNYQGWALSQIRQFDRPNGWQYEVTLTWIVSELNKFENATEDEEWVGFKVFPSFKELIQEKVGVDLSDMKGAMLTAEKRNEIYNEAYRKIGWKNSIHEEIAYRATRDGMVIFLLPIQPHLLDPPIAQLYQKSFSKAWDKLEGREDQLYVAEQSAKVKKISLEEATVPVSED